MRVRLGLVAISVALAWPSLAYHLALQKAVPACVAGQDISVSLHIEEATAIARGRWRISARVLAQAPITRAPVANLLATNGTTSKAPAAKAPAIKAPAARAPTIKAPATQTPRSITQVLSGGVKRLDEYVGTEKALRTASAEQLDATHSASCELQVDQKIRLSWRTYLPLASGQTVIATVRLKPPWGTSNPATFDYGLWLLTEGYSATGYIRHGEITRALTRPEQQSFAPPALLRHWGLLQALSIGKREQVAVNDWQLFRATGTIHLMVVSGLHVSIAIALVFLIVGKGLRLLPWQTGYFLALSAAWWAGVLAALGYAQISGFGVPVVRASLMFGIGIALLQCGRRTGLFHVYCSAAFVCLLVQPLAVLTNGFWLSFAAVGWLLFAFSTRLGAYHPIRNFALAQGLLCIGMTPVLGLSVGSVATLSVPANFILVPLVSLFVLPLTLAALLAFYIWGIEAQEFGALLGRFLLRLADIGLDAGVRYLRWLLRSIPLQAQSFGFFSVTAALTCGLSLLLWLVPLPNTLRRCLLLGIVPVLLRAESAPPYGEMNLFVVDVGQGSAALVDTHSHRLLIDTGARFASGLDQGEATVIPSLRMRGIDAVDAILLTHLDLDHAGGFAAVRRRYPRAELFMPGPWCRHGHSWVWDGVTFTLLFDRQSRSKNNRSCTVLITNGNQTLYISGDIEAQAEKYLLPDLPRRISLLVSPHHGSRTSSSLRFVRHVQPRWVIHSAAKASRYGHPHPAIRQRYRQVGSCQLVSGEVGGVVWQSLKPAEVLTHREGWVQCESPPRSQTRIAESVACAGGAAANLCAYVEM